MAKLNLDKTPPAPTDDILKDINGISFTPDQMKDYDDNYLEVCGGNEALADELWQLSHIIVGNGWVSLTQFSALEQDPEVMGAVEGYDSTTFDQQGKGANGRVLS